MNWIDRVHALDLDNHDIARSGQCDIRARSSLPRKPPAIQPAWRLRGPAFEAHAAGLIGAFEESRPKHGMNSHRGADDLTCDVVYSGSNLLRCGSHEPAISQLRVFSL